VSFRIIKTAEDPTPRAWLSRKDFVPNVATLTPYEQELIMRGNARQLTFD
jgi:hypothetical protein